MVAPATTKAAKNKRLHSNIYKLFNLHTLTMNKLCLAGLAVAALVSSCSDDLTTQSGSPKENTIGASVSAEGTRVGFTQSGQFYWSKGDQLAIWYDKTKADYDKILTEPLTGVLTDGAGSQNGVFTVVSIGSDYSYAVYPYNQSHVLTNNNLTYSFPATYNYYKVDTDFFTEKNDGNSYNPAMAGPITKDASGNNSATINHLGGVLCVKFEKMPCASGELKVSSDNYMAGKFSTTLSATATVENDMPKLTNTEEGTSTDGKRKYVRFTFDGATQDQPGVFYVPVPTGTYNNVKIELSDGTTKKVSTTAGTYPLNRADLYPLTISESTVTAGVGTEVSGISDANTTLSNQDNVTITGVINGQSNIITIPAATTGSTSTTTKTIMMEKIAAGAKVEVKEGDNTNASTANDIVVSVPNPASSDKAAELDISTPNSTVTIQGNAGLTYLKKVNASTAEHTLIVTDGVTIGELEILKGNVRINKGATVKKIDAQVSTIVYYEKGATVPSSPIEKVKMYEIGVGTNPITTEAEFATAMSKGGEYTLVDDLTLSNQYTNVCKTVSVDLNTKTLTAKEIYSINGGDLTFKNGNIKQEGGNANVAAGSNGKLTLDNIVYSGTGWNCVFVINCSQKANLVVKNSTIHGGYYSVTTNASTKPEIAKECTITLENSTFAAEESGALLNIPATVTMKNCKFSGNHQGAFLRGGTYTIEDCEFTLNATLAATHSENHWMTKWSEGNQAAFAALTLGNYINDAYAYETNITFTGKNTATVSGTNTKDFPAIHTCSNAGYKVTITGIKDHMTTSGSGKNPDVEYGTSDITVDGVAQKANVKAND